ncbi:MAG: aryl-sulfate sulfotransferase [Verrucomicrobiota bacterium]
MKMQVKLIWLVWLTLFTTCSIHAYEALQGPTELLYWDKTNAYPGYTWFGVRGITYLVDMEGRVVHTWPIGTNPHVLTNGNVLDAGKDDPSSFGSLSEVDWNGSNVWTYTESRTNYLMHHDFTRIFNPKLNAFTTLYIANKTVSSNQCIAAGADPANGRNYTNAQMDAIVEVDMSGNIVWEWWFFDHMVQDFDTNKLNWVGTGKTIADYPGRLNINIPGLPVQRDWLHCNSIDYNQSLDQILINSVRGEFYIIDHGNTFTVGNPSNSIALAASTNGDFLYRFGDPARYNQGNPPSILTNWTVSTTGNKQIGGAHHASWIPSGFPGAGHLLIFNNAQNLFEHTQGSYAFEINPFLNALSNIVAAYVNPPVAGYNTWQPPVATTGLNPKLMSRQIAWNYSPKASHAMFSHIGGSVQRLPNGNTLICSDTEGHIIEVTSAGDAVWEYINPVTTDGILKFKRDNWPMYNSIFRAFRIGTNDPVVAGRTLTTGNTITGRTPSYKSP